MTQFRVDLDSLVELSGSLQGVVYRLEAMAGSNEAEAYDRLIYDKDILIDVEEFCQKWEYAVQCVAQDTTAIVTALGQAANNYVHTDESS